MNGNAARQRRFEISVFLPLDELPSQVVEPHLPEATGCKAPVKAVPPGLEIKPHEQARSWTWFSEAILDARHEEHFISAGSLSPVPLPTITTLGTIIIIEINGTECLIVIKHTPRHIRCIMVTYK